MDVRDKTILVTGAGRGIGRSLALHFARKGANLALMDTNREGVSGVSMASSTTPASCAMPCSSR